MKMIIDGHEIESYFDESEVDAKTCATEPQHNPNYKNYGSKTYDLILPEFKEFDEFDKRDTVTYSTNIPEESPFTFKIRWGYDVVIKHYIHGFLCVGDPAYYPLAISRHYDHPITKVEYDNIIHELQQAYKDWVFNTLFKEIEQ